MNDSSKMIFKLLLLVGAGLGLYWWLQSSGYWQLWFGTTGAAPNPLVPGTTTTAIATTPVTATTQAAPSLPSSYIQAAGAMTSAAGASTQNFDQWSWFWQNNPSYSGAPAGYGVSGSISGNLIDAMIAAGGGNRAVLITALQWVTYLYQAQQQGISGLGFLTAAPARAYGWVN